jgi:hypothetical protein
MQLPCPLAAGWDVVEQVVLPPQAGGGFSAGAYRPGQDELWLLSDASQGSVSRWRGLRTGGLVGLEPLPPLPLADPQTMDGEGLAVVGSSLWVASEGRLAPERQAALLRYDLVSGQLRQVVALPADWRLQSDRGLRSNAGPESLTVASPTGALWMAAEKPLQQDPPDRVRLLRWEPAPAERLVPWAMQPLAIPAGDWGLTDLLALTSSQPPALLGIWRRFEAPGSWQARLVLYPWPSDRPGDPPLAPSQQWNLLRLGLAADNWEVLLEGPPLPDGRSSLLLASDDNFNPLQASHLARLAPRRLAGCRDGGVNGAPAHGGQQGRGSAGGGGARGGGP